MAVVFVSAFAAGICPENRILFYRNTNPLYLFTDAFGTATRAADTRVHPKRIENFGRRSLLRIRGVIVDNGSYSRIWDGMSL